LCPVEPGINCLIAGRSGRLTEPSEFFGRYDI
jgi:hypothetical protein